VQRIGFGTGTANRIEQGKPVRSTRRDYRQVLVTN